MTIRKSFIRAAFLFRTLAATNLSAAEAERPPAFLDTSQPLEARVEDLLARLTLEEKISLLHADSKFTTAAIPPSNRRGSFGPRGQGGRTRRTQA